MPSYVTYSDAPITPAEAHRVLVESGLLTIEQFNALTTELRGIAFAMARVRDLAGLARIRAQLVTALDEGWGARDFIRWCRNEGYAWERQYSELVFRNAVSGGYSRGRFAQMMTPAMATAFPVLMYDAIRDARTTELCRGLDGKWWRRPQFPLRLWPPNHHACLPGGAMILPGGRVSAASKRWFDGDVLVVRTASGRLLTCTPNHPVLTDAGWVAACCLEVGGHVIADGRCQWEGGVGDHAEDVPARIHDVAEALFGPGEVLAVPVPLTAEDFHGDAADGHVAVVGPDRKLTDGLQAALHEHLEEQRLEPRLALAAVDEAGLCRGGLRGRTLDPAHVGRMGGGDLAGSLDVGHARPPRGLLGARISNGLSGGAQRPQHRTLRAAQARGNSLDANSGAVQGQHFLDGERAASPAVRWDDDPGRPQPERDDAAADLLLARDLIEGRAIPVLLDEIVNIEVQTFHGFVFNLSTEGGWFSAGGIVTHNCRSIVRMMTEQQARARFPLGGPQGGMIGAPPPAGWDGNSAELWQLSLDRREALLRQAVGV